MSRRNLEPGLPLAFIVVVLLTAAQSVMGAAQGLVLEKGKLNVFFLDVEQGNCVLVVSPTGSAALIDAGTGTPTGHGHSDQNPVDGIQSFVEAYPGFFSLQYVIATHFDADHIGKLDDILEARPALVSSDYTLYVRDGRWAKQSEPCSAYHYLMNLGSDHRIVIRPNDEICLGGDVKLTCLAAAGEYLDANGGIQLSTLPKDLDEDEAENGCSVVLLLEYGQVRMWFGGDLISQVERELVPYLQEMDLHVNVYMVDHHGAKTSSEWGFVRQLKPDYAICQVGDRYNDQPSAEALNAICCSAPASDCAPVFIQQNPGKACTPPSDCPCSVLIADPDGGGSIPGLITVTTDGCSFLSVQMPTGTFTGPVR